MKKRIACFLLAALLVLSAMPLFVFAATAEQLEEEEAVNYDDLYVKLGLSFQFDTFKTNPFWDPEGDDFTMPTSLYEQKDEEGNLLFDELSERVVADNTGTEAFKAAITEYKGAWDTLLNQFKVGGTRKISIVLPDWKYDKDGTKQLPAVLLGNGYFQFTMNSHKEARISLAGDSYGGKTTVQYVTVPGENVGGHFFLYRGVGLSLTAGGNGGYVFKSNHAYANISYEVPAATAEIAKNVVGDFTISVEHPEVSGADARKDRSGNLLVYYNTTKMIESPISYAAGIADTSLKMSLLHYGDPRNDQKLYAVRVYDRDLDTDEILLNHFADLAKYYKLDVNGYFGLTEAEKIELANTFADVTVGNHDAEFVDALRLSVVEKIEDLIYGSLLKEDQINSGCAEFTELAKSLKLDISSIRALPVEYRQAVYSASLGLIDKSKENVEETIEVTINAILEENFGDYMISEATITYKDLYVKQDNLKVWVDFFAAKESDGLVYDEFSYTDGKKENAVNHIGNTEQPYNADVLFQKYRFRGENKGANSFYFKKVLANEGTNIRAYGDGCLKTGYQNMIGLYSPGEDSDVTYQLVTKAQGKDGATGGSYTQFDGIRFTYGIDKKGGFISALDYYGFGSKDSGVTFEGQGTSMIRFKAGKQVYFDDTDLTVVVDKANEKSYIYYDVGYITDNNGNPAYTAKLDSAPDVSNLTPFDGKYEYRTMENAKLYVDAAGNLYWYNGKWQSHFYLVDKGDGSYAYCDGNGNEWILANADDMDEAARKNAGATFDGQAVSLVGPLYDNSKITEVPADTENALGPFECKKMSVSAYANGTLLYKVDDIIYRREDQGLLGSGADMTIYAIRTYDCVLTQEEIRQNHFADLAGYYGFDLSIYSFLNDTQKKQLYDLLATMQLGDNREACIQRYEELLCDLLYSFDSESEAAHSFRQLCDTYSLKIDSLLNLSVNSQERVFESFSDIDPTSLHYRAVLQARLEKAVESELFNHYEESTIQKTVDFSSWQLHVYGDPGFRAVFEIDEQHLSTFTVRNTTATIGMLIAEKGNKAGQVASIDGVKVEIAGDGSLVIPEGVSATIAYENGRYTEAVMQENGEVFFSEAILPDEESYAQKYYCVAFVVLKTADGENIVYLQNAPYGRDNAPSLGELSEQALALNWAYPNVQTVLTKYLEDDGYNKVAGFIGSTVLSDFRVSIESSERKVIDRVNPLINFYFGVSLIEGPIDGHGIYIGKYDSVYEKSSYGVTVQNGDLYIWYNDDAQIDMVIDLLDEILAYHYNLGGDIVLPNGFNEVRKVMAVQ